MKNFFQKQREIVAIASYICLILALIYFVILPLISRINGVKDEIQEESLNQEIKKQQIEDLPKMQSQFEILQKNEELLSVLLNRDDAVVLIEKLEKAAESSGNKISISVQDQNQNSQKNSLQTVPAKKPDAKKPADDTLVGKLPSADYLQMKITLTGNYNSMLNFIGTLEKFEYYADIIGIQIKQSSGSGGNEQSSSVGDFGFVKTQKKDDIAKKAEESKIEENLETSLDVVFYSKK